MVRADVRGKEKPRPIGSRRLVPDIEATIEGHRHIIEVETPASLEHDKEQVKWFASHAAQRKDTTFELVLTKPRKK